MQRKLAILGSLLLVALFLASTGLLEPRKAFAGGVCDASVSGDDCLLDDNGGTGTGPGGSSPCRISDCDAVLTCSGTIYCTCLYTCPSGPTSVTKVGACPYPYDVPIRSICH